ncbi:MAG: hypothetical protein V1800_09170 [Candidatus Latescibacterota bacterium]
MKKLIIILLSLGLCASAQAQQETWDARPARVQLDRDPTIVPMGKGAIFIPSMTNPIAEPMVSIYQNGRLVTSAKTGNCVLVEPGTYEIKVGSGTIAQTMIRTVEVDEGHITLLEPDWCGLVIDMIDEKRTSVKESYELFYQSNLENYGIGYGVDEELGEELRTWLLRPGLYKIVKTGQSFYAPANFATVRLFPGELVKYSLVVDSETGNFVGFGVLDANSQQTRIKNWKIRSEINGSFLFNFQNTAAEKDQYTLQFLSEWYNYVRYTTIYHNFFTRFIIEEGLSRRRGESFRKFGDKVELRSSYSYRFFQRVGPYVRFAFDSKVFTSKHYFDKEQNYVNAQGDTVYAAADADLSPSFFPLHLKEGIGASLSIRKSLRLNASLRAGFGARQTFVRDSYKLIGNKLAPMKESHLTGMEVLLTSDARVSTRFAINSEFDMLMPGAEPKTWVYDWENRIRIFLTKWMSLDYTLDLFREEAVDTLQSEHRILVRFSFVL